MPRRGRRGRTSTVQIIEAAVSPVGVTNIEVNRLVTGATTVFILPTGAPLITYRPTSAVLSFASATPVSWIVRAHCNGNIVYESRVLATCGNSITAKFRAPRSTDYGAIGAESVLNWNVQASGAGLITGVATFSSRGSS